jgi:hypothetical protein
MARERDQAPDEEILNDRNRLAYEHNLWVQCEAFNACTDHLRNTINEKYEAFEARIEQQHDEVMIRGGPIFSVSDGVMMITG